jgi:hypothetical protein
MKLEELAIGKKVWILKAQDFRSGWETQIVTHAQEVQVMCFDAIVACVLERNSINKVHFVKLENLFLWHEEALSARDAGMPYSECL